MKWGKLLSVVGVALASSLLTVQGQLTFNFSSTSGSTIQFNGTGSSFQFNPLAGPQWQIGSEDGGTGSAVGLLGTFGNSPFSYGPITTELVPGLTYEFANVTGPLGAVSINDGVGYTLTGSVDWIQVSTANYSGAINGQLDVNVSNLSYSGSNPDLLTLFANAPASMNLSFQFSPGKTLSQLSAGTGPYKTSFSGSLAVVPEPTTTASLLLGLGVLIGFLRLSKKQVS